MKSLRSLQTGDRVAVIGGGPAGSFFAMYLQHYASQKNIQPQVTIYQERNFGERGPKGCKGCAGLLSISLLTNLHELGLSVPDEVIQSRIDQYAIHSPYTSIILSKSEKEPQILSVYRGGGPSAGIQKNIHGFDEWLLSRAIERGAALEYTRVSAIKLGRTPKIMVEDKELEYDLVVMASGINSKPVSITGINYIPPISRIMTQGELYADEAQVKAYLGNIAHAFLIPHSNLIFGTLVPKGASITVSILSYTKSHVSMSDFLSHNIVRERLPPHYLANCRCQPQTLIKPARNYYSDGFVALGDAAVSRIYKDGIGSSLIAAREVADTIVNHGTSSQNFKKYYQPYCSKIATDNQWGRFLFAVIDWTKDSRIFLLTQHRIIGNEQHLDSNLRAFSKSGWGMFTGNYMYTSIASMVTRPRALSRFFGSLFTEVFSSAFRKEVQPRSIHVSPKKVLILGSGFGGTYVLRHLVPSLNRNENVNITMVSDENFFLFSPLLHEVAMGVIEIRHIAYSIRRINWRDRFHFIHGDVTKIDINAHKVFTTNGVLEFDYLVLALGSVANPPGFTVPGGKDGNLFQLKSLIDSLKIRNHIIETFEQASLETDPDRRRQLLTFVVSGAGYTGIETVTELREFVYTHLNRFYKMINASDIKVILVEAEARIVAEMDPKLSEYTLKYLLRKGIELRIKSRVTKYEADQVEINGEEVIPANTLIWVAGVVANPRIFELDVPKDNLGRVAVNLYLELPGHPGVYAVGDCAYFQDRKTGHVAPPRAHNAVRQAKIAAYNILAEIRGRGKKAYHFADNEEIVSLGASTAVLRFHGIRMSGIPARLIWLVAYTLLITGSGNRIRIVMDWFLSFIFGRDTTLLKLDEFNERNHDGESGK